MSGADADGPVYLGVGPREFRLAKQGNSFEANKPPDKFILGSSGPAGAANVRNPDDNDPLKSITRIEIFDVLGKPWNTTTTPIPPHADTAPHNVYIRYESNNKWLVESVKVTLSGRTPSAPDFDVDLTAKDLVPPGIWLGADYGKFLSIIKRNENLTHSLLTNLLE